MERTAERLRHRYEEVAGGSFRGIAYYKDGDYETVYLRKDVEAKYSLNDIDEIMQDAVLDNIGERRISDLFEMGELSETIRCLEDGVILHFHRGEKKGFVASFDTKGLPELGFLVKEGRGVIEEK